MKHMKETHPLLHIVLITLAVCALLLLALVNSKANADEAILLRGDKWASTPSYLQHKDERARKRHYPRSRPDPRCETGERYDLMREAFDKGLRNPC